VLDTKRAARLRGSFFAVSTAQTTMTEKLIFQDSPQPIRVQLREILQQEISEGKFAAGKRFPSERELAGRFMISRASVRETIGELISLGVLFRTVGRGTFVASKPQNTGTYQIAFLISEDLFGFAESGYGRILRGVEDACRQAGDVLVFRSLGSESGQLLSNTSQIPDGVVIVGGVRRVVLEQFRKLQLPVILVDLLIHSKSENIETVNIDYASGTRLAVERLHQLGHQMIGFIGFAGSEKYEAYWQALEKLELKYEPRQVEFLHPVDLDPGILAGFRAMQKIIARTDLPTALIATNDYVARGAIEALDTAGIRVPEHISIIGYDDLGISVSPPLTTIRADLEEVGRLAMEVLRRRIQGSPDTGPLIVPTDLVERGSSAPLLHAAKEGAQSGIALEA